MRTIGNFIAGPSLLLLLLLLLGSQAIAQKEPKFPQWNQSVQTWDAVGLLKPETKKRISEIQKALKSRYSIGLWVVVIDSQKRYTPTPGSIESFAQSLIIQKIRPIAGNEDFVLLLVAKGDRKSRIELGRGWANRWNQGCDLITQQALIPNFKQEQYDSGILAGVESLAQLVEARQNPTFSQNILDFSERWGTKYSTAYSLVPPACILPFTILGLMFFLLAFVARDSKLVIGLFGLGIIVTTFFTTILLTVGAGAFVIGAIIFGIFNPSTPDDDDWKRRRGSSWTSSSSGSSSSGGSSSSSSGYSSGGGSTGSW